MHSPFYIRCRGLVVHEGRLLLVKHAHTASFAVIPGGHLEYGESVEECLSRELEEELGIKPEIGRLLFIHIFPAQDGLQVLEFIYEVKNGLAFVCERDMNASHAFEIADVLWVTQTDELEVRPKAVWEHFKKGTLFSDTPRHIVE